MVTRGQELGMERQAAAESAAGDYGVVGRDDDRMV